MEDFEVPVNIAVGLDSISQMRHLIVNTTQRSSIRRLPSRSWRG